MPSSGTLSLYVNDVVVGSGQIRTQPGKFSLAGEGLCVGRDSGEPVTADYPGTSPWPAMGCVIEQVIVDVSGEPYVNLEHEARAAFMRD
jgi:arylsulfatase